MHKQLFISKTFPKKINLNVCDPLIDLPQTWLATDKMSGMSTLKRLLMLRKQLSQSTHILQLRCLSKYRCTCIDTVTNFSLTCLVMVIIFTRLLPLGTRRKDRGGRGFVVPEVVPSYYV